MPDHLTSLRRITTLGLLVSISMMTVGCGKTAPKASSGVTPTSRSGSQYFDSAYTQYVDARARDLRGETLERQMSSVMLLLQSAIDTDPDCALFKSKLGDVCLENAQPENARRHYDASLALQEDWVHGWIGRADVRRRSGDYAGCRSDLASARAAWQSLRDAPEEAEEPGILEIIGLDISPPQQPGKSIHDPTLDEHEARMTMVKWMRASEAWTIFNPPLAQGAPGMPATLRVNDVFRRVRARIEWQAALLIAEEPAAEDDEVTRPVRVVSRLKHAREWDPDFFPATLDLAILYRRNGEYQQAQSLLLPWATSGDARFSENSTLQLEMALVYADWFDAAPDRDMAQSAEEFFRRVHELDSDNVDGYIARADFYIGAGSHFNDPANLDAAESCLQQVRRVLGTDTNESRRLWTELETARSVVSAEDEP